MKHREQLLQKSLFSCGNDAVITTEAAREIINLAVQEVLEQIEDCKFSQLGELIEKLKEEYK